MDRIKKICSRLERCKIFADVACDHGYCAEYMLKNNLCERVVISDISAKSLSKAENLLSAYIEDGRCVSVCCDGLEKVSADTVLIAGIGGEEIVKILKNAYIPENFVFQPMKNAQTLREYLLSNSCELTYDGMFEDCGKYYFLIKGRRFGAKQQYSKAQLKFGKDSLNSAEFNGYAKSEIEKKRSYLLAEMSDKNRKILEDSLRFLERILNGEIE